jgi:hypothetical protein
MAFFTGIFTAEQALLAPGKTWMIRVSKAGALRSLIYPAGLVSGVDG